MGDRPYGLGGVVGALKSISAIAVNGLLLGSGRLLWLEDYYEHVIHDVEELEKIRDYIFTNPARWLEDPENPDRPRDV
jgi:putative transposase